jgi:hypothetical protein
LQDLIDKAREELPGYKNRTSIEGIGTLSEAKDLGNCLRRPKSANRQKTPCKFRIAPRSFTEERFEQDVRRCIPSRALSAVEQAPGVLLELFEAITYDH